jgi:hypothetical protein
MAVTDSRRYPRLNERGLGPATSRQLWRLNAEGLIAFRKEAASPLSNRDCARVISELADARQRARFEREPAGVEREPPGVLGAARRAGRRAPATDEDPARLAAWQARAAAADVRNPRALVTAGMASGGWPDSFEEGTS